MAFGAYGCNHLNSDCLTSQTWCLVRIKGQGVFIKEKNKMKVQATIKRASFHTGPEHEATFTLERHIKSAREEIGEAQWKLLQKGW